MDPVRSMVSTFLTIIQYGILAIALLGNFVEPIRTHPLYMRLLQNRMPIILGGYFGINIIQGIISSTGAF